MNKGAGWKWVPVGLLVSSTVFVGSLALIAVNDPSFALEPNYYEKALHWDRAQAQAADNRRLGYQIELEPRIVVDSRGNATVSVRVLDASGHVASGVLVHGTAFANAFANDATSLELRSAGPGLYSAPLRARHLGLWEFRLVVSNGAEQVTSTLRRDVVRGAG